MVFLRIDVGSSSVKGQTIDEKGRQIEFATLNVTPLLRRPRPTWAERNASALWEAVCAMLRSMKHLDGVARRVVKIRKNFAPKEDARTAYLAALERFASITERLYGSRKNSMTNIGRRKLTLRLTGIWCFQS